MSSGDAILAAQAPTTSGSGEQEILLAEDDPIFRTVLRNWLHKWGYAVIVVADGDQAWAILEKEKAPQLVILDWMMPGIDGVELCRRLRASERSYYQYVLLVTAKDETEDVIKGLEAGADDYLRKPFAIGELRARLVVGKRILALQDKLIRTQDDLRFRATHDALTGIWNRLAILGFLDRSIEHGRRSQNSSGLLIVDLDHFKAVNDNYGHLAGDVILQEAARRIVNNVRPYDLVGRYGGEEFLVVLSDCNQHNLCAAAERIRRGVCDGPVHAGEFAIKITVSVGAAVASADTTSAEEVLRQADAALYEAKNAGRNCTRIFTPMPSNGASADAVSWVI